MPLRNAEFPRGFTSLKPADAAKVEAANSFIDFSLAAADEMDDLGAAENPGRSWLWAFEQIAAMLDPGWHTSMTPAAGLARAARPSSS